MANAKAKIEIGSAFEIDRLGTLLAQISDLTKEADAIKDSLKDSGIDVFEGYLFRATVSVQERNIVDKDRLALLLGAELPLAYKKSSATVVRVVSR